MMPPVVSRAARVLFAWTFDQFPYMSIDRFKSATSFYPRLTAPL